MMNINRQLKFQIAVRYKMSFLIIHSCNKYSNCLSCGIFGILCFELEKVVVCLSVNNP